MAVFKQVVKILIYHTQTKFFVEMSHRNVDACLAQY